MDTTTTHQTTPGPDGPGSGPPHEGSHEGTGPSSGHLVRLRSGRMLAGVAAGLADWFEVDPTLVRVAFAALALLGGVAVPIYLAAWLLIPEEGAEVSVAEELLARERVR